MVRGTIEIARVKKRVKLAEKEYKEAIQERNSLILELRREGYTASAIGCELGLSRQRVYKVLQGFEDIALVRSNKFADKFADDDPMKEWCTNG